MPEKTSWDLPAPVIKNDAFDVVNKGSGSGDFLRSVRMFSSSTEAAKQGLISPGNWGEYESKEELIDHGPTVDVLPLDRRLKAVDFEARITTYNYDSEMFQDIMAAANDADRSTSYGTSFLVYLRDRGYREVFFSSASSREKSKDLAAYLPREGLPPEVVTLGSTYKKSKKFSWHVPTVAPCSVPIELPDQAGLLAEIEKFREPSPDDADLIADNSNRVR